MIVDMPDILLFDLVHGNSQEERCAFSCVSGRLSISGFDVYWNQQLRIDAVRQTLAAVRLDEKLKGKKLEETLADLTEFESAYDEYYFSSLIEQTDIEADPIGKGLPPFGQEKVLDVLRSLIKEEPVKMTNAEYHSFLESAKSYFKEIPSADAYAELRRIQEGIVSSLRRKA